LPFSTESWQTSQFDFSKLSTDREVAGVQPPTLQQFIESTSGFELEPWQVHLSERLEKLKDQKGQRLLIHGPPQFGKSIILSQRYPAWVIGTQPDRRVRLACYNETHAARFSKVNLEIMRSPEYRKFFPSGKSRIPKIAAVQEWSTPARAAHLDGQPSFAALGLGTGFTGLGGDDILIDDPYKNKVEAYSPITNENIWGWWSQVVTPRLNPESNVVVLFHRWKQDDFAGRLMEEGGWEILRYAAVCDEESDIMGREIGETLSDRYPKEWLEEVERKDRFMFAALYQGTPRARDGNMIKIDRIKGAKETDLVAEPVGGEEGRGWDLGGSNSKKADRTAGVRAKLHEGIFYICHCESGQWSPNERNMNIRRTTEKDQDGKRCKAWIERPIGLAVEIETAMSQMLTGTTFEFVPSKADKVTRADPFAAAVEAGNARIVRTGDKDKDAWIRPYLDELASFPFGKNDDKVDGTTLVFTKLTTVKEYIYV
jgi:predicted phage terminase large subunit-like protein